MKRFDTSKRRLITLIVLATSLVTNPAVAGLFGPDIELLSPGEINTRLHEETVLFSPSGTPLQIKTKGAAVGGFLVGMILSSAMASSGGGGATNAAQLNQQMQANMAIAQQTNASIQGVVNDVAANVTGQQSPELAKLGISAEDWEQIKSSLKAESGGSGAVPLPEDSVVRVPVLE